MVEIGNDNNNRFWEKHYQGERLLSTAEKEVRKNFIQAKYVTRSWIPTGSMETKDSLSRLLCDNLVTYNLLRTIELLALGANVSVDCGSHLYLLGFMHASVCVYAN